MNEWKESYKPVVQKSASSPSFGRDDRKPVFPSSLLHWFPGE
jgi:hypothetical protein